MRTLFILLALLCASSAHAHETQRLVTHFDTVIAELEGADTRNLTPVAQAARQRLIAMLGAYRDARRFPRNPDFAQPTPYFIDGQGTRCAMAHLIEVSGHSELVEAVASTQNNAYIKDLADDPTLLAWLDAHGLTVAEAARIQPTYRCLNAVECLCGFAFSNGEAIYQATVSSTEMRAQRVHIDAIIGNSEQASFAEGMSVRATLRGASAMPVGTQLLGVRSENIFVPTHIVNEGEARCATYLEDGTGSVTESPYIPINVLVDAAESQDCQAALLAHNPALNLPICNPRVGIVDEDCNQHPGSSGSPLLAILLLGAVSWRTRR